MTEQTKDAEQSEELKIDGTGESALAITTLGPATTVRNRSSAS